LPSARKANIESVTFVEVNRRACERLGYTRDELCKLTIGDLWENVSPELGIEVIAEGVETAKQLRLLQQWGCRRAQGVLLRQAPVGRGRHPHFAQGKYPAQRGAEARRFGRRAHVGTFAAAR
jgi:EAL domain-containing protein (putative c-di-GMP-specific phosphodiesterase class I)